MAQDANQGQLRPVPELSAWLAIQHQAEQESIAAKVAAGLLLLWPILAFRNLKGTTEPWLHASLLQVQSGFVESGLAAADFVQSARWLVEPDAPTLDPINIEFPARDVTRALEYTGPGTVRRNTPGIESEVMEKGQKASSGAAQTAALDGGREQVLGQVLKLAAAESERAAGATSVKDRQYATLQKYEAELADLRAKGASEDSGRVRRLNELADTTRTSLNGYVPTGPVDEVAAKRASEPRSGTRRAERSGRTAIGWARVTDSNPCYFCAMLASLGAYFVSEDSFKRSDAKIRDIKRNGNVIGRRAFVGDGQAKVHDNCKCTLRPVFSMEDSRDKRAKDFLKQWEQLTKGESNFKPAGHLSDAVTAFRKGYEPPPPYRVEDVLDDRRAAAVAALANRDVLLGRGLGDDSPQVAFWEGAARKLEAI